MGTLIYCAAFIFEIFIIVHIWKNPGLSTKGRIGWTFVVILLSWIGMALYWFVGKSGGSSKTSQAYREMAKRYDELPQEHQGEELVAAHYLLFCETLVHPAISYKDKCRLIELHDERISKLINHEDFMGRATKYMKALHLCYSKLNEVFGGSSLMVAEGLADFESTMKGDKKFQPMSYYLGEIMSYAALLGSPDGNVEFDSSIFNDYKIPNWPGFVE